MPSHNPNNDEYLHDLPPFQVGVDDAASAQFLVVSDTNAPLLMSFVSLHDILRDDFSLDALEQNISTLYGIVDTINQTLTNQGDTIQGLVDQGSDLSNRVHNLEDSVQNFLGYPVMEMPVALHPLQDVVVDTGLAAHWQLSGVGKQVDSITLSCYEPSTTGQYQIDILVNDVSILDEPMTLDVGQTYNGNPAWTSAFSGSSLVVESLSRIRVMCVSAGENVRAPVLLVRWRDHYSA